MTADTVHPDAVLRALLEKRHRRDKEEKLRKLHECCAHEYERHSQGARDFSIANISRLAEHAGLFKARTIYNAQSKDYVTLIQAWNAYNGPVKNKLSVAAAPGAKYSFLDRIEDPAVRSLCQMAIDERDRLQAEINLLKSKTILSIDMRPTAAKVAGPDFKNLAESVDLTESERESLISAIDRTSLARRRWRVGKVGEVLDENNRMVFPPGFATAIAKILEIKPPVSE